MGLKQDIVIVNEFSVPKPGGGGSRGGTPGAYVTRYMARETAVEPLAPIRLHRTDDFILRYMARESAVEHAPSAYEAKVTMRKAQGHGGVAFGYGQVSLSHDQLVSASKDIQHLFEQGHTVLKTVLSFDEEYLRRHGLIPQDFRCERPGDYRGHLDQMKLRMAIMHGLDRMSHGHSGFDDLRFIAVVQVDTAHVHCHLAMVDAGRGHLAPDGTQRGKLSDRHRSRLRRGVDSYLDEKQHVAHLSSAVGYERRNVTTYIKRWAHERMQNESLSQFLLACLPKDRTLWRAGSNHAAMRKPHQIVYEMVNEQLMAPGSPLPIAMEKVLDYANSRRVAEDLNTQQWQRLVAQGRSQIVDRAVNGVYQLLRTLPEDELVVRTPMLSVMSMDYEELAALQRDQDSPDGSEQEQDLRSLGFRMRSYSSRLRHHREQQQTFRDLATSWRSAHEAGVADEDSRVLYDFYRLEADYHARCMAKYQHFLPFAADPNSWYDQQERVASYGQRMLSLMAMRGDAALQRMKDPEQAERIGMDVYGQHGGRWLTQGRAGRAVLDERIASMRRTYDEQVEQLQQDVLAHGLVVDQIVSEPDQPQDSDPTLATSPKLAQVRLQVRAGSSYPFEEVRGLDAHRLTYDFVHDVPVDARTSERFIVAAQARGAALSAAMEYLQATDQAEAIDNLPVSDITQMQAMAAQFARMRARDVTSVVLPSRLASLRQERAAIAPSLPRSAAPRLDDQMAVRVRAQIEAAVLDEALDLDDAAQQQADPSALVSPELA